MPKNKDYDAMVSTIMNSVIDGFAKGQQIGQNKRSGELRAQKAQKSEARSQRSEGRALESQAMSRKRFQWAIEDRAKKFRELDTKQFEEFQDKANDQLKEAKGYESQASTSFGRMQALQKAMEESGDEVKRKQYKAEITRQGVLRDDAITRAKESQRKYNIMQPNQKFLDRVEANTTQIFQQAAQTNNVNAVNDQFEQAMESTMFIQDVKEQQKRRNKLMGLYKNTLDRIQAKPIQNAVASEKASEVVGLTEQDDDYFDDILNLEE